MIGNHSELYIRDADFMNTEACNMDSFWKLSRSLQDENKRLKEQLEKAKKAIRDIRRWIWKFLT